MTPDGSDEDKGPTSGAGASRAPAGEETKVRCFIAVNLSVSVVRHVADAMKALRTELAGGPGIEGLRFASPESLHVTLRFLGSIPTPSVEVIRDATARIAAGIPPFELRAQGLGRFPEAGFMRVLWIGLEEPSGQLERLAGALGVLDELGFRAPEHPFRPHLTIARLRDPSVALCEKLEGLLRARATLDLGVSIVREVVVYRSDLKPRGAEYTALARIPLGVAVPDFTDMAAHRPPLELEDD